MHLPPLPIRASVRLTVATPRSAVAGLCTGLAGAVSAALGHARQLGVETGVGPGKPNRSAMNLQKRSAKKA